MLRNSSLLTIFLCLFFSACLMESGDSQPVPEKPDAAAGEMGNIFGTIYNPDSTPAAGASVWLLPSGHVPVTSLAKTSRVADSVVADGNGRFGFHLEEKGYHNLLVKGDRGVDFQDSIYIRDQVKIRLDAALEIPGAVRGVVRFSLGKKDHSGIVILILGTNLYTMPEGSGGQFQTPPLASGRYTLRLLTVETGYGFLDREITVTEGISHTLQDTLFLPATGPKRIDSVSVTFNKVNMQAHVSWPAFPQDLILGYNVYRSTQKEQNQKLNGTPLQEAQYLDKVMAFEGGQVDYIVTTVDREGQETLPSPARSIRVESVFKANAISLEMRVHPRVEMPFAEDAQGNFYFIDQQNLYKLDSLGKVLITLQVQQRPQAVFTSRGGFVYAVASKMVRKYDAYLTQVDSVELSDSTIDTDRNNFYVSWEGMLYIFEDNGVLRTYDASFSLLRTDSLFERGFIRSMHALDGKLLVQNQYWLNASQPLIYLYDREMNRLDSPGLISRIRSVFPGEQLAVVNCILTRDGRYVLSIRDNDSFSWFVTVFNKDMDLLGIKIVPSGVRVYVNDKGDIRYYDSDEVIVKLKL